MGRRCGKRGVWVAPPAPHPQADSSAFSSPAPRPTYHVSNAHPPRPLAADLATGARTAQPATQVAHLSALQGALLTAGERLTPDTIAKVGVTRRAAAVHLHVPEAGS